jgi:transcriptional regulator with XRE-family HTH domain
MDSGQDKIAMLSKNLSPAQARMARAAVRMTVAEVGKLAHVSANTISSFEIERTVPHSGTLEHLRRVYEERGITFTANGVEFTKGA